MEDLLPGFGTRSTMTRPAASVRPPTPIRALLSYLLLSCALTRPPAAIFARGFRAVAAPLPPSRAHHRVRRTASSLRGGEGGGDDAAPSPSEERAQMRAAALNSFDFFGGGDDDAGPSASEERAKVRATAFRARMGATGWLHGGGAPAGPPAMPPEKEAAEGVAKRGTDGAVPAPSLDGGGGEAGDSAQSRAAAFRERMGETGWLHGDTAGPARKGDGADLSSMGMGRQTPPPNADTDAGKYPDGTGRMRGGAAAGGGSEQGGEDAARAASPFPLPSLRHRRHRISSAPVSYPCCDGKYRAVLTEHVLSVPLDPSDASSPYLDVAFTVVDALPPGGTSAGGPEDFLAAATSPRLSGEERAALYALHSSVEAHEAVLFLQGGPGFGAPAPVAALDLATAESSWASAALGSGRFRRVVLLDPRGTGRSSPVTRQTLEEQFADRDGSEEQWASAARYLSFFRAASIVYDAECVRDALHAEGAWGCALGQSFGGFCLATYLSAVDHPPRVCLFTGGIPPMGTSPRDCYAYPALWDRVAERNRRYYANYPDDVRRVKRICRALTARQPALPSGGTLTARRFLQLGMGLGSSPGSFAHLHRLLGSVFVDGAARADGWPDFSRSFLRVMDGASPFDDHPLYFLLHEAIYCDGPERSPSDWAAHRSLAERHAAVGGAVRGGRRGADGFVVPPPPPDFRHGTTAAVDDDGVPTLFTGEMVFPWMAEGDYAELSGPGMRALARALAGEREWDALYDADRIRQALQGEGGRPSRCVAAAAVYVEDMYVDFERSAALLGPGGALEGTKGWLTNEYQHSGIRDDGARIFTKLLNMAQGTDRTPS